MPFKDKGGRFVIEKREDRGILPKPRWAVEFHVVNVTDKIILVMGAPWSEVAPALLVQLWNITTNVRSINVPWTFG